MAPLLQQTTPRSVTSNSTATTPAAVSSDINFDVIGAVKKHKDGCKVLREYDLTNAICEHKELFVRIVVATLIDHNDGSLYPSTDMKTAMAKAILRDFPNLHSGNNILGGHDAYFAPFRAITISGGQVRKITASGYIEERLKTLRINLTPSKKPHKKHVFRRLLADNTSEMETDATDDGLDGTILCSVRRLQHEHLIDAEVDKLMEDTFEARKDWIQTSMPPVKTVFSKFPPLKDILSNQFQKEFLRWQPTSIDFFETWAKLTPHIITYAEMRSENAEIAFLLNELNSGGSGQTADVINYKPPQYLMHEYAVYLLPHLIQPPVRKGRKRVSAKEAADAFVRVVPVGSPIEPIAESAKHPLIVATGSRGSIIQHYLLLEGQATQVPSLLCGVEKAFKLHYLFNIAYSSSVEHVWQFVQKIVFCIHDATSTFSSVHEFHAFLRSKRFCIPTE